MNMRPRNASSELEDTRSYLLKALTVVTVSMPSIAVFLYTLSVCDVDVEWLFTMIIVAMSHHSCSNNTVVGATLKSALAVILGLASIIILGFGCRSNGIESMSLSYDMTTREGISNTTQDERIVSEEATSQLYVWKLVEFSVTVITFAALVSIVNRRMTRITGCGGE